MTTDETITQLTGRIAVLEHLVVSMMPCMDGKLDGISIINSFTQHSPAFLDLKPEEKQAATETLNRIFGSTR